MKNTQLLKGVLEGCVLLLIQKKEVYGYELVQKLKRMGFTEMVGGTVYPLLQKLEKKGALTSHMKPSADGPDRKYYQVTAIGDELAEAFLKEWQALLTTVEHFTQLEGGLQHD
jgi:PadR family transcriptional regulator PadR